MPAVTDVVEFLRQYPPFDVLPAAELDAVASRTEIEFYLGGTTVLEQGMAPADRIRVIRTGSVELIYDDRVLDLLSAGELFGQASMMSGLPAGFTARTTEDSLVYSLPAVAVQTLLARPGALRFLLRSVLTDPVPGAGDRPPVVDPLRRRVGSLIRMPMVVCRGDEPVRSVAARMTDKNASAVLICSGDPTDSPFGNCLLGIVTDNDLRSRVLAAGVSSSVAVADIMSSPVHVVASDRLGGDALLEMIGRGVKHLVVLSAAGKISGVLTDQDLVSAETRTPFLLRRRIDLAQSAAEVATVASSLRPTVVAMRRGGAPASQVSAVWSVVVDSLTSRLVTLAMAAVEPQEFSWLALGSLARREAVPSSDVDSAVSWPAGSDEPSRGQAIRSIAATVTEGLASCGLRADAHQVSAADEMFSRSLADWQQVAASLLADPAQDKALLLASILLDHRAVWGAEFPHAVAAPFGQPFTKRKSPDRELLLHMLARYALVHRPPTGFLRDFVVESGGDRRGLLDLKRGGILPIVDLARWAGLNAGVLSASTPARLRAASAADTLPVSSADTLLEAFEVLSEIRLDHQIAQLEAGLEPDDFIRPSALSSIVRAQLKETFRALATVQRAVNVQLQLGTW